MDSDAGDFRAPHELLPLPQAIKDLEKSHRGSADWIFEQARKELAHRRRHRYVGALVQLVGYLCGFGAVLVLADLSRYFVNQQAPREGAAIIITGAVALVGTFVTGRIIGRNGEQRQKP